MKKLNELSITETVKGLKSHDFSSTEVTKECVWAITKNDKQIHAFVTTCFEGALKEAQEADEKITRNGEKAFGKHPLLGVPFALKDNFCTKGLLTTASSNIIRNFIPPYESAVSQRLKDAGAVLLGKTNLDAFAHGSSTESSDFLTTRNPHNHSRLPGGSSGGSAAAVAANMCIFAIGSETAGSIRQPASWCGVVGFKPTYGRVSRYGVIAMASSTDSPGPITKTVADSALVLNVISGKDIHDSTTSDLPVEDYSKYTDSKYTASKNRKLKVGVAKSYFIKGMEPEVKSGVMNAVSLLKNSGYEVSDVDLIDPKYSIAVFTIIQRSEVSSNLGRFDGIRYGYSRDEFGFEAKKRIMLGTYTLSAGYYDKYYSKAQKVRTLIINDFNKAFKTFDVIVGPITPCVALEVGAAKGNAMFGELQDILNEPSAMAGITAISIPCGFSHDLPIGIQIMANRFEEGKVLSVSSDLERLLKAKVVKKTVK